jgi:hypothetical protein
MGVAQEILQSEPFGDARIRKELLRVGKEDVISCLSPGVVSKKIVKE